MLRKRYPKSITIMYTKIIPKGKSKIISATLKSLAKWYLQNGYAVL